MDIKTIICPNCGASTSNFHNCEYCGSFLVRKVREGTDLTSYLALARQYQDSGIATILKNYVDTPYPLSFEIRAYNQTLLSFYEFGTDDGIGISILAEDLVNHKLLYNFKNSNVYNLFHVEELDGKDYSYDICFGYDYKGAAQLASQFLTEVCGELTETDAIRLVIWADWDKKTKHEAIYSISGQFISGSGDGANQFNSANKLLAELSEHQKSLDKFGWKEWLFAIGSGLSVLLLQMIF